MPAVEEEREDGEQAQQQEEVHPGFETRQGEQQKGELLQVWDQQRLLPGGYDRTRELVRSCPSEGGDSPAGGAHWQGSQPTLITPPEPPPQGQVPTSSRLETHGVMIVSSLSPSSSVVP